MAPLKQDDTIKERTAVLAGAESFADVEKALSDADALFLKRESDEELVLVPIRFWNRLMANVAVGWDYQKAAQAQVLSGEQP